MGELAVGILALAGLFNNAVDCFEYVDIGKNCTRDFTTYQLRLDCARLRLSRWGATVGLSGDLETNIPLQEARLGSSADKETAQGLLNQVIDLFAEVELASSKYKQRKSPADQSIQVYNPDSDLKQQESVLHKKLHSLSLKRRNSEKLSNKVKWALYEERRFGRLIEDITGLVGDLQSLFPLAQPANHEACEQDASELASAEALPSLRSIAETDDKDLASAISKRVKSDVQMAGNVHMFVGSSSGAVIGNSVGNLYFGGSR